MPSCPPLYECKWSQTPQGGDSNMVIIGLVAIVLIVAISILIFNASVVYENTHKSMEFKVK